VPQTQPLNYNDDLFLFILLCVKELLFGMVMGYVVNVFFMLTYTAGQIIDMQMGFGMVNVFDVQTNISVPVTANMLNIVMILSFFAVNGHHRLYYILYESLEQIPIGAIVINPNIGWIALQLFIEAFILAVIVAMPIIGSGLVGEACFGILMKAVPQMNAFSIGIPIKMLLGFLVLAAMMPFFVRFTNTVFDQMYTGLDRMFAALTG
jgi:flagellar biosynthetic protein FliR